MFTHGSCPPRTSFQGFLRPAKIGLASKGMTHEMTKLLCLSVRLGLYPTDICWLRLIPGSGESRDKSQMAFSLAILLSARFIRDGMFPKFLVLFLPTPRNINESQQTQLQCFTILPYVSFLTLLVKRLGRAVATEETFFLSF